MQFSQGVDVDRAWALRCLLREASYALPRLVRVTRCALCALCATCALCALWALWALPRPLREAGGRSVANCARRSTSGAQGGAGRTAGQGLARRGC
jgi:hypothetical protein